MSKDSKEKAKQGISLPVTLNFDGSPSYNLPLFAEMVKTLLEKNRPEKGAEKGAKLKDESEATESRDVTDLPGPSRKTGPAKGRKGGPGPLRRRNTKVRYTPYLIHSPESSSTGTGCGNRSAMNEAKTPSASPVPKMSAMHVSDTLQQELQHEQQQQQQEQQPQLEKVTRGPSCPSLDNKSDVLPDSAIDNLGGMPESTISLDEIPDEPGEPEKAGENRELANDRDGDHLTRVLLSDRGINKL